MKKIINNKGITLVALVITIIILIILAGITLSLVFREDGLINKAKTGGESYKEESVKESIHLAYIGASTNSELKLNENEFRKSLNEQLGEGNYTYSINNETGEITVVYNGKEYKISSNGTMEESEAEEEEEEYTGPLYTIIGEVLKESGDENSASLRVKLYDNDLNEELLYSQASTTPKDYGEFNIKYTNQIWYLQTNSDCELYYSTSNDGTGIEKLEESHWAYWYGTHYYIIKAHNYSIKYKLNGGINCPNMTYTAYSPTFTLPIPMREGYYFTGWTENEEDTPQRNYTITKGTTGNKKFIANWQESDFTVIGEVTKKSGDENASSITVKNYYTNTEEVVLFSDASATPKMYDGYNITYTNDNWYLRNTDGYELYYSTNNDGSNIQPLNTVNWAYWYGAHYYIIKARNYTITYNLDGGYACENRSYTKYTPTFTLPKPVKNRSRFTGWTGSNGETAQIDVSIPSGTTGNKTYTANWIASEYTPVAEITKESGDQNSASVKVKMFLENTEETVLYSNCTDTKDYTYFNLKYGTDDCWHIIEKSPNETYYSTTLTSESYTRFSDFKWAYWYGAHYYVLVKN